MEELPDNQVKAALTQALSAVSRAKAQTKTRFPSQLNNALTQAIQSFDPAPAPSPFPTDNVGNRRTPPGGGN